ncbi:DJ-1/PfpI family protein [Streptomyces sp. NEAU-W12]|uniref:DJ-1/PfpI family protein n=1 Tax=Streptomyces sp. NEAU-W12 TaxID=2994668 RepID=UPI003A4C75A5
MDNATLDSRVIEFLADRGATASYITSVCTGSLVLATAGLLDGYRAATHWSTRDLLARLGVEVSTERVCIDRNRISGGGVGRDGCRGRSRKARREKTPYPLQRAGHLPGG